jgi:hypothetical protein
MSCQNASAFRVAGCASAISNLNSCIDSVGVTFDNLIQYISAGALLNAGTSYTILSDPQRIEIVKSCLCSNAAQEHIQFLICYGAKCAKNLNMNILTGSGLYWSGFCLSKT